MGRLDFYRRIFIVILGFSQPIIILMVCGHIESISSSWETCLQPLFIFVNALTSYFFFDAHRWRLPSIFLLGLTAFSVSYSLMLHNILAILFYLSCLYPIYKLRRYRWYMYLFLGSILVGLKFGLFWGEVFGIYILTAYHINVVVHMFRLGLKKRHQLEQHLNTEKKS